VLSTICGGNKQNKTFLRDWSRGPDNWTGDFFFSSFRKFGTVTSGPEDLVVVGPTRFFLRPGFVSFFLDLS
jgi:hypothetical protein